MCRSRCLFSTPAFETTSLSGILISLKKTYRLQRLMLKQKNEADGLQQKATQGRRELDLSRQQDIKRREQRFKNVLSELANLQKLEQVQLEHFLQQQAIAGKRQSDKKGGAGLKGLSGGRMLLA